MNVLITGGSGLIGGLTIAALGDKYEFSGLSRRPMQGITHTQADITDAKAIEARLAGAVVTGVGLFLTMENMEGLLFDLMGWAS